MRFQLIVGDVHRLVPHANSPCQTKVCELCVIARGFGSDQYVFRLEVAENDVLPMEVLQGEHDANGIARHLGQRQTSVKAIIHNGSVQIFLAKLHKQPVECVRMEDVNKPHDERVVRHVQRLGLAHRALRCSVLPLQLHRVKFAGSCVLHLDHLPEASSTQRTHRPERREPHLRTRSALMHAFEDLGQLFPDAFRKQECRQTLGAQLGGHLGLGPESVVFAADEWTKKFVQIIWLALLDRRTSARRGALRIGGLLRSLLRNVCEHHQEGPR
mmetsp:Transcript_102541/g.289581  ORF Transcript_102541/g.289581 Transcript_102541/m.289581 type:complete len:271 (+) Transcript_102541:695-1507(+)